ncbi:4'-phosphopantetheinyl transferase family protein [Actinopolymorpha alba]|uniref:4'-phosphopantetheinyl transferase family protein n=1 Tax=Actinopolymorpha alba TaxID=533267 RepID=UPI00058DF073|nr:4'-phosphopantetheinyl transferase superfamily protein [Actinopolymorpha alba]
MTPVRPPRILGRDPLPFAVRDMWPPDTTEVWMLSISQSSGSAVESDVRTKILDAGERERAAGFLMPEDQERYTAAHLALRMLLGAYLDVEPATVRFTREACTCCGGPHGRPTVVGTPLHFSMSRSGDLLLFAFAGSPIGADVETVQPLPVVAEVSQSLHPAERAELDALPEDCRSVGFARCWTRKEAYLKGIGTGLFQDPAYTYVGTGEQMVSVGPWTLADIPVTDADLADSCGAYAAAYALLGSRGAGSGTVAT